MKSFISICLLMMLLFGGALTAQTEQQFYGDLDPWPLGTECPFQLDEAAGTWKFDGPDGINYIQFIVKRNPDGEHQSFEIYQYDQDMNLYATGAGLSPEDTWKVSAGMRTIGRVGEYKEYWAYVRSYIPKKGKNKKTRCGKTKPVKILTLMPINGTKEQAVNYQLEPASANEVCQLSGGLCKTLMGKDYAERLKGI